MLVIIVYYKYSLHIRRQKWLLSLVYLYFINNANESVITGVGIWSCCRGDMIVAPWKS